VWTKRFLDVLLSAFGLIVLSPFLAFIAWRIKRGSRGPVFYRGLRVGRDGRLFRIYKFRTMIVDAEVRGGASTADDDPRITSTGAWLRRHKFDELPQFINIVQGDMSLVGPRPQVVSDVALYTDEERGLLSVRPGLTDFASLRFRNEGEILRGHPDPDRAYSELIRPEKIRLGLEYVRARSLLTDCRIVWDTVRAVLGSVEPSSRATSVRRPQ
jgi:lipopolysaccharide/colanic/teichoic acid biosynthesis glycosyltransferase